MTRSIGLCFLFLVACEGPATSLLEGTSTVSVAAEPVRTLAAKPALLPAARSTHFAAPRAESSSLADRTWFLTADGRAITLELGLGGNGSWNDDEGSAVVEHFKRVGQELRWETVRGSLRRWFRVTTSNGVLAGRWAEGASEPLAASSWNHHLTGWNQGRFESSFARTFRLLLADGSIVTLRLDGTSSDATALGTWKQVGSVAKQWSDEGPQFALAIDHWDGTQLVFRTTGERLPHGCSAVATGRTIEGTCQHAGSEAPFSGTRIEVLGFGLLAKSPEARERWQTETRAALQLLTMAGNPAPGELTVEPVGVPLSAFPTLACWPSRDDDVTEHPTRYLRQEYVFSVTYPLWDGTSAARRVHGWLLTPDGPPPSGGFPAVVALNGHGMSSVAVIDPNDALGWYGDAFARRGYVVFAVDVSHRPLADRASLYVDSLDGDDPARGNGSHPAIRAPDQASDWEEDGERVADAMRARDFLASLPVVDSSRIAVTGISMGGEVTTWAAALEPRFFAAIPIGYSPDAEVFRLSGNHPCYRWQHGDVHDYVDTSDLHALVAPRRLVVETGMRDWVFSALATHYSGDLQTLGRSRLAYADASSAIVHYLHPDEHRFRAGDLACGAPALGLTEPILKAPTLDDPLTWQTSAETARVAPNLFAWLGGP